jgi:hypothetical protein
MENYLFQYQGASNLGLTKGKDYTLKIVMKGSAEGKMHLAIGEEQPSTVRHQFLYRGESV